MARAMRMLSDEELADVLSPQNLGLPAQPRVVDIKFAPYEEDSSGEEGLDIYVIVDDSTPLDKLKWVQVQPVFEAIQGALQGAGESRYPYFDIGTRAQYDQRYTYNPETDE